jgi:hypothetical protein
MTVLEQAHKEWVAARAALAGAETTGKPSILTREYGQLFDREREAYEALIAAQVAALKPTCHVADSIVTWDQVAEGDLVVDRGLLVSVAATEDDTSQSACIRLKISVSRDPERDRWVTRRRDYWTAVRRYVESED